MARPSSQEKSQPSTDTASASATSASNFDCRTGGGGTGLARVTASNATTTGPRRVSTVHVAESRATRLPSASVNPPSIR